MIRRNPGEVATLATRSDAEQSVDKKIRYRQIIECLKEAKDRHFPDGGLTAKECAVMMVRKGYIPTSERNFTAPRLTELSQRGVVEPIGKKLCAYTGRLVAVYSLRGD